MKKEKERNLKEEKAIKQYYIPNEKEIKKVFTFIQKHHNQNSKCKEKNTGKIFIDLLIRKFCCKLVQDKFKLEQRVKKEIIDKFVDLITPIYFFF